MMIKMIKPRFGEVGSLVPVHKCFKKWSPD